MAAVTALARDVLALNEGKEITITSKSAKFYADAKGGDYKTLLLFANAGNASATATISVGNGIQGAGENLVVTVGSGKTVGVVVDSGFYKFVSGDEKDTFEITPSAALSVSVIELPQ